MQLIYFRRKTDDCVMASNTARVILLTGLPGKSNMSGTKKQVTSCSMFLHRKDRSFKG